jgi:hypothetical protein
MLKNETIALAKDYVTYTRGIVSRRRKRVDELRASGNDSTLAEEVLATFQKSLNLFENRLQKLLEETSN